jgi:5'-nucleotidase
MNILVTNDDGGNSKGTNVLVEVLKKYGHNVFVFIPSRDYSGTSSAISLNKTLSLKNTGENIYTLEGTPVDCVIIGLNYLKYKYQITIDLVISGINDGLNIGKSKKYSGTIGAAIEGLTRDIKSIALSCCSRIYKEIESNNSIKTISNILSYCFEELNILDSININILRLSPNLKIGKEEDVIERNLDIIEAKYMDKLNYLISVNSLLPDVISYSSVLVGELIDVHHNEKRIENESK